MWKPTPSPRRVLFTRHQALAKPDIAPLITCSQAAEVQCCYWVEVCLLE